MFQFALDAHHFCGGEDLLEGRQIRDCLDPSRPGVVVGRYRQAGEQDVLRAVETAAADPDDEPPGVRERSCGLRVGPATMSANSVVTALPTITAPARRSA